MLLTQETFKRKPQICQDILVHLKKLTLNKQLNEEEATLALNEFKENVLKMPTAESFSKAVFDFLEKRPAFKPVQDKIKKNNQEAFEKINETALEDLIEQNPETWKTLISELENLSEENYEAWIKKIPAPSKSTIYLNML